MILYLDTSALVKLYADEEGSDTVRQALTQAEAVATSRVAYAEARAAFARKQRETVLDPEVYRKIVEDFERDWERYFIVEVSDDITRLAGQLAEQAALRGFDAIHLASALLIKRKTHGIEVAFLCFDQTLLAAGEAQGLKPADL